ncbi:MAG: type II secretion system F family protein [Rhodocyclaceae bacterium]|nr:type II secretion system F family protein [Rhodocyclaceae bacterium]
MNEFRYRAVRNDGSFTEGRLSADSRSAALAQIERMRLTPIDLQEAGAAPAGAADGARGRRVRRLAGSRIRAVDVEDLTRSLSVMLRSGVPLDRALKVIAGMAQKEQMARVVGEMHAAVKGGKSFSAALGAHQQLFGDFYINMVRAGEAGGQLADVLARVGEHLERLRQLREGVVSAMIYPMILVVVALLSVFLLLTFVVPQFETLFEDMGDALPLPTAIIVAVGHFLGDWWWLLALLVAGLAWGGRRYVHSPRGRHWKDAQMLALPVIGDLIRKYEVTRFSRSMGTLLGGGVSIVQAVRIAAQTVANSPLRQALDGVAPFIKKGGRMADALTETGLFTPLALNMVRLGEETGRLDTMLLELARVHDTEVQAGIKRALTLIEPVLILTLGVVIAAIIVSILMGILSVNDLAA